MKQSIWSGVTTSNSPTAYITNGFKQRLKQFDKTVYLKDSDTFQIELYNPKQIHILAKIKINGQYISGGGIVLRPGERVFLERFLDSNNKFVFRTYEVDGTSETLHAISNNGLVEIEFYDEYLTTPYYGTISTNITPSFTTFTTSNSANYSADVNIGGSVTLTSGGANSFISNVQGLATPSKKLLLCDNFNVEPPQSATPKNETGVIDKGGKSSQSFTDSNRAFHIWTSTTVTWKILPLSQKQYQSDDIKAYCTECGAKIKKSSHKFCPHCGTKY